MHHSFHCPACGRGHGSLTEHRPSDQLCQDCQKPRAHALKVRESEGVADPASYSPEPAELTELEPEPADQMEADEANAKTTFSEDDELDGQPAPAAPAPKKRQGKKK